MNCKFCTAIVGVAAITASIAVAQTTKDAKQPPKPTTPAPAAATAATAAAQQAHKDMAQQMPQLPKGWTEADMQACMAAGTPGAQHEKLAECIGTWSGKTTMWMAPDTEPTKSECTSVISPMMDGRFTKCETTGDMPGMGPFSGFGIYGYDNVSQKYQCTWIDNCGTGMMTGTGEASSDGKTMTWTYNYTCPITKKPTTMREVHKQTGKDTQTMEMYSTDPKSGKEFKMMEIALTRQPGKAATAVGKER